MSTVKRSTLIIRIISGKYSVFDFFVINEEQKLMYENKME